METDFVNWLLESPTPSIRYLTLTRLEDRPESDPDVKAARAAIMTEGPVPDILARQTDAGHWANERSYYTPKYVSTHWSMLLLAELAADGTDPRLRQGAAFMLESRGERAKANLDEDVHGLACFWANIVRYVVHCGYGDDPRTLDIAAYVARDLNRERVCLCAYNEELACAWGAARALWGLAALPSQDRAPEIESALRHGLDFLLTAYDPVKADYPTEGAVHRMWGKVNFPLFYQADILLILRAAADLDALEHPGAGRALDWLESQRGKNGRWRAGSPYASRTYKSLRGDGHDKDRWASLQAAGILKKAGRL